MTTEVAETDVPPRRYRRRTQDTRRLGLRVRADVAVALEAESNREALSQSAIVEAALVRRYRLPKEPA